MSKSYNRAVLMGNVGKDPEVRYTGSGVAVASFSLATSDGWGDKEETNWHTIVAWKKTAEICGQYVKKGSPLLVEGRIQYRSYDAKDGSKRYVTEIVADRVVLLGSKSDKATAQNTAEPEPPGDSLPF